MNRLIFSLLTLALSFQGPSLFADAVPDAVTSLVRAEWQKISSSDSKGPPFWSVRVTPGIPCAWPVKEGGSLCYYAYAAALDPQLADGERTAAPWAKVTADPAQKTPPKLEVLMKEAKEIGIQGVRPLNKEEIGAARDPKDSFCFWVRNNGVIAGELKKLHRQFFDSLECR
jgi:hypothetical protein